MTQYLKIFLCLDCVYTVYDIELLSTPALLNHAFVPDASHSTSVYQ